MKRRVILIVLPVILVLAVMTSPALAKDPEQGLLWETIRSVQEGLTALAEELNEGLEALQEQIDGIQAYLANFTEEDPVFSAMDTEAELEAQIGDNVLTVGENISMLNNNAGYITHALQAGDIQQVTLWETVDAFIGKWDNISFSYDLPEGAIPLCANGEVWVYNWDDWYRLDADSYSIYPSFFYWPWQEGPEEVLFRCYYSLDPIQWLWPEEVEFHFYYSYILP